jgi:hypothetical protein
MQLTLSVTSFQKGALGQGSSKSFADRGGTIGRVKDNDWVLPDPERIISSRHAVVQFKGGGFYLTDTSANGTFLNGASEPIGNGNQVVMDSSGISITAAADREATVIRAEAERESSILRGQGEGLRTEILNNAYGQDPAFFNFYRSMQAYSASLGADSTYLVLTPDSEFFSFFNQAQEGGGN